MCNAWAHAEEPAHARGTGSLQVRRRTSKPILIGDAVLHNRVMQPTSRYLARWAVAALALAPLPLEGQQEDQRKPRFTSRVELVTTDVVVRDKNSQFLSDLKIDDFEVLEDGVAQKLVTFSMTHGGRTYNATAPAAAPVAEGILLPPPRPPADETGRVFFIFVDDQHLNFRDTARVRNLFKQISDELIHQGDMFGIVSTGPSSIAINLTYDRRRLTEAAEKFSGNAQTSNDIVDVPTGSQGPPEVRHRAHVAFSTARDVDQPARADPRSAQGADLHQQRLRSRSLREDPREERDRTLRPAARQRRQQRRQQRRSERSRPAPAG